MGGRVILIIEGADLVGKSTIANAVSERHHWPIVKVRWRLVGDPEVETRAMAASTVAILKATRPDVIFDRIYFSWWAYGPALGHEVDFMPEIVRAFQPADEARLVLLTASPQELSRRFDRHPDDWFSLDVIQSANERFPTLLDLLPPDLRRLHIDTSKTAVDTAIQLVEDFIDE